MLTLLLDNKPYLAPIDEKCQNVIDLGCGAGICSMDFADAHPSAGCPGCRPQPNPTSLGTAVRLHSSPWPSGPKRTKRISQPVRFISGVPYTADCDNRQTADSQLTAARASGPIKRTTSILFAFDVFTAVCRTGLVCIARYTTTQNRRLDPANGDVY
jgi:hypothetical protein